MRKFLDSCRNCYALIGLATVIAFVSALSGAGWAVATTARALGYLPYKWRFCEWLGGFSECSTGSYNGPESFLGYLLFGVASVGVAAFLCNVLAYVLPPLFSSLDKLGRDVVNH